MRFLANGTGRAIEERLETKTTWLRPGEYTVRLQHEQAAPDVDGIPPRVPKPKKGEPCKTSR